MTHHDQQILFTALAFVTVLLQEGDNANNTASKINTAAKIKLFAQLIGEFCAENVVSASDGLAISPVDDKGPQS